MLVLVQVFAARYRRAPAATMPLCAAIEAPAAGSCLDVRVAPSLYFVEGRRLMVYDSAKHAAGPSSPSACSSFRTRVTTCYAYPS